jgi:hypothetical protein
LSGESFSLISTFASQSVLDTKGRRNNPAVLALQYDLQRNRAGPWSRQRYMHRGVSEESKRLFRQRNKATVARQTQRDIRTFDPCTVLEK